MPATTKLSTGRRGELLTLACGLFAEKGFQATTVRDIAEAAGILSGSLYHHFDSKETMVDEIIRSFQDELFAEYDAIMATNSGPREKLAAIIATSFESIHNHRDAVAIYQHESKYLQQFDRFSYLIERNKQYRDIVMSLLAEGVSEGVFRADLDVEITYRFIRDSVWVAVGWYHPERGLAASEIAERYLGIVLEGIARK
ncbi:TetR/AcrR family transcriptional regulator [Hoyosella sp. YIM 151337]|uniref:TetR/AcrR family transcriptional regulator n=1 Tax=Hoyosella sp. YIM 151337 TaxID=2992742 RepID=UPI002235CA4E|nr:TetR/AcrR family transcriptional regulator [Hoyosella sp. YIM 151337]MCW4354985.1 TetR/AcrR family transcriptional regulator [Hoyosella sp. YIM 151337]